MISSNKLLKWVNLRENASHAISQDKLEIVSLKTLSKKNAVAT